MNDEQQRSIVSALSADVALRVLTRLSVKKTVSILKLDNCPGGFRAKSKYRELWLFLPCHLFISSKLQQPVK